MATSTMSSCSNFLLISPSCNYKPCTNKLITSKKTDLALPNSNSIFLNLKSHTTVSPTTPPPLMEELNEATTVAAQLLNLINPLLLPAASTALPFFFLLHPQDALAVGGELGILEGRSFALLHPLVMAFLFFYTCWAGYLGWQWRRVRTTQNEINELKKQVPSGNPGAEGGELAAALTISPIESKIQQLTEERKVLIKGSFRDRHFNAGSILLAFGVIESVGGCLNTYFRTGKLFPGPHLFSGAAITVLWALAAALIPAMQKGNETARNLHIALNALNVVLFIWQIPTGLDIVYKVFEFTKWP